MSNLTQPSEIYFHVGLPKTASTFLQRNVFPQFQDIHFVKKHDFQHRDKIIANYPGARFLLSIEMDLQNEPGLAKIRDVSSKYPQTRPIVVFRKHGSWLKSKYKYYLRKHGSYDFDHFFDLENNSGVFKTEDLFFYDRIQILEKHFQKKPLVFFQEELKKAPFKVIDQMASLLNVRYNPDDIKISNVKSSYSEKQLKLIRKFNRSYKFDKEKVKPGFRRFCYKKFGGLLLHSVAYAALLIPDSMMDKNPLIPKSIVEKVNKSYQEDWQKCVNYARDIRNEVFL